MLWLILNFYKFIIIQTHAQIGGWDTKKKYDIFVIINKSYKTPKYQCPLPGPTQTNAIILLWVMTPTQDSLKSILSIFIIYNFILLKYTFIIEYNINLFVT